MQTIIFKRLWAAVAVVLLAGHGAQAQDPWGQADDVPTLQAGDSWIYNRTFTISLGGILAPNIIGPGVHLMVDGALDFQDIYELEVNAGTPTAVVNTGFRGFQNTLAYVKDRISGTLSLTGAGARLFINTLPDDYVDMVLTLSPLDSSTGVNHVAVGDLAQIQEQFATPLVSGTIQATTGTVFMCSLVDAISGSALQCGGPPAPFQAALDVALLHAIGQDNVTTGGLDLLDFPTIDPVIGNGTGERWNGFGVRGIDGELTLIVPSLSLNTVASIDFATSASMTSALMNKNVADPNAFAADNRHIQTTVFGSPEEIYYSPAAKELSYWKLADFSATTLDGLIVGMVDFTTALASASVALDGDISLIQMAPPRPLYGQQFTVSGIISPLATSVNLQVLLPGGGGSSATVPITIPGTFSANLTAPTWNDGTPSPGNSTEREIGSFGVGIRRIGGFSPPHNQKTATVRLGVPSSTRHWNIYE